MPFGPSDNSRDNRDQRGRVSIIDDDESVRRALERLLRSAGYETASFDSSEAFLAANSDDHRSCLILDVQLPGISGMDLHAKLLAASNPIPVVMITAGEDEAVRKQAVENGVVAFLRKPFHTEQLLDAVKEAMSSTT
jgi:FixJ family two-component response regulator